MILLSELLDEIWPFKKKPEASPRLKPGDKKAGDVWQTASGRWGAKNRANPYYARYFSSKEMAEKYAASKATPKKQPKAVFKPAPPQSPEDELRRNREREEDEKRRKQDQEELDRTISGWMSNKFGRSGGFGGFGGGGGFSGFGGGGGFSGGGAGGRF